MEASVFIKSVQKDTTKTPTNYNKIEKRTLGETKKPPEAQRPRQPGAFQYGPHSPYMDCDPEMD